MLAIVASEFLLHINHAGGQVGAKTPIHAPPGSEAAYAVGDLQHHPTRKPVATQHAKEMRRCSLALRTNRLYVKSLRRRPMAAMLAYGC